MTKLKNITKKEAQAIAEYETLLLEKFPGRLKNLILFGSKARGDSNPNSDIDLLVVLSKNGKETAKEIVALTHLPIAKFMVDISPVVVEESFFKNWSPLLEHIKKDGIKLWTNDRAKRHI